MTNNCQVLDRTSGCTCLKDIITCLFCHQVEYLYFIPAPNARLSCALEDEASSIIIANLRSSQRSLLPRVDACYTTRMNLSTSLAIFGALYQNTALSVFVIKNRPVTVCWQPRRVLLIIEKSDKNSCDRGQVSTETLGAELCYLAVPG